VKARSAQETDPGLRAHPTPGQLPGHRVRQPVQLRIRNGHPGTGTNTERYKALNAGTVHVTLVQEDNANHIIRRYSIDVTVR